MTTRSSEEIIELDLVFEDGADSRGAGHHGSGDFVLASDEHEAKALPATTRTMLIGAAVVAGAGVLVQALGLTSSLAGITSTSVLTSSAGLSAAAQALSVVLGPLGAAVIVLASMFALRRNGHHARANALFVGMGVAWMVASAVSLVTAGTSTFILTALAFPAAMTTMCWSLLSTRKSEAGAALGALVVAHVAVVLVAAGVATVVGAVGSVLVGILGAGLGIRAWNRWGAPIARANERVVRIMETVQRARSAQV